MSTAVLDGDLYIVINVKPHKLFERRGQDLWLEIPITFDQAALGDDIVVPTLEGKVSYKVPARNAAGIRYSDSRARASRACAAIQQGRSLCER